MRRSRTSAHKPKRPVRKPRAGVATLDYILVLGVIFPIVAVAVPVGKRLIQLVYEMSCVWIAWPFL